MLFFYRGQRDKSQKFLEGGGECDLCLCWHPFSDWLACLQCHQPSLQSRLFPCQLARLSVALTLPATFRDERQRWGILGWHHTSHACSSLHFAYTHAEICVFQFTHENGRMHRDTKTDMHAYSLTLPLSSICRGVCVSCILKG